MRTFATTDITISTPTIIPRPEHSISRAGISPNALKVLYRLKSAGFAAHLVGGGVRDLLLGREPKDFDVATDARPEEVHRLFRNCRLIGRRFRLAHVHFGPEIIEVATFRAAGVAEEVDEFHLDNGRIVRDNVYGNIEEDAWRRDFTVNALYYNVADFSVVDYTDGMTDLRQGVLRLIGDPERRYREDPVRMLRAVRFASKLGFRVEPQTEAPLFELGHLLADIPSSRLFEEVLKLFFGGVALQTFEQLRHYGLFGLLFPLTETSLSREEEHFPRTLVSHALANTDERVADGLPVSPTFLFAALLWDPLQQALEPLLADGLAETEAVAVAADRVLAEQNRRVAIPRRIGLPIAEIWQLQSRLEKRGSRRPARLVTHPRFRAAYDLLVLRARAHLELEPTARWWTEFQGADEEGRRRLAAAVAGPPSPRRRRGRRKPTSP